MPCPRPRLPWLAFAVLVGTAHAQTTWFVDASAVPPGDGTRANPFASIQHAHDQAATLSGDTLSIAPGDYAEPLLFAQGKALTLRGAGTAHTRLLGGLDVVGVEGTTRVLDLAFELGPVSFQQSNVELERVAVTGVRVAGLIGSIAVSGASSRWSDVVVVDNPVGGAAVFGASAVMQGCSFVQQSGSVGGLFASSSTLAISNSTFADNHVFDGHGGALHVDNCQTTLVDCAFEDNVASQSGRLGGAIYQGGGGQLTILGGTFTGNRADRGGALALLGPASLRGVTFRANVAQRDGTSAFMTGQGGAIYVSFAGTLDAEGCTFLDNAAPEGMPILREDQVGGALYALFPGSRVCDSLFSGNVSGQTGSSVYGPVELVRCVVRDGRNTTAGGALQGAQLERCTVVGNVGGPGSAAVLSSRVSSSILWANAYAQLGDGSSASFSCVEGGAAGLGNFADDPQFVDLAGGQLELLQGAPCIDAGNPAAALDADWTPADMGALPFTWQSIGTSYCSANPNSSGQTAVLAVLGSTFAADDFVRVQATQTATHQLGLFLMSQNQGFVPFFNGSQGNLCLSGPIFRIVGLPDSAGSSGELGVLNTRLQLVDPPYGPSVLPGQTWNFQAWFRDVVAGQGTTNTSDAVSIPFQ